MSLPVRGAWIEIKQARKADGIRRRRSPYGERGLKFVGVLEVGRNQPGRSPYGERGLK